MLSLISKQNIRLESSFSLFNSLLTAGSIKFSKVSFIGISSLFIIKSLLILEQNSHCHSYLLFSNFNSKYLFKYDLQFTIYNFHIDIILIYYFVNNKWI